MSTEQLGEVAAQLVSPKYRPGPSTLHRDVQMPGLDVPNAAKVQRKQRHVRTCRLAPQDRRTGRKFRGAEFLLQALGAPSETDPRWGPGGANQRHLLGTACRAGLSQR
ncbi:unnamed protein product [Caretta caretta]